MRKNRIYLLVDDDIDDQDLFAEAVHEIDSTIQCYSVFDCEEALQFLRSGTVSLPDLIFLDLNLPRINGKQCLIELKNDAVLRDIPVIIYSTSSERSDIAETARLGAVHFLTKPNRFGELCNALRFVISRDWHAPSPLS